MKIVRPRPLLDPTSSRAKTVASDLERSRALRTILLKSLRSLRKDVRLPTTVKGDISSWIVHLHGLKTGPSSHEFDQVSGTPSVASLTEWMVQIAGPEADPRKTSARIAKLRKDSLSTEKLALLYRRNRQEFDSQFKQQAHKLRDTVNIPDGLPALSGLASIEESLKIMRATRALAMCLSVHGAHPLSLIARATKGDRRAALDLIKVDKLFLHDSCTQSLIKKAELQNDQAFMKQLARAQVFVPKLPPREMQRLYFYQLFLMEQAGIELPPQSELWRILDPRGQEYDTLSSFERDLQRRRKSFMQMLNDLATEIKGAKL
jgi:hypothetical protein